MAPLPENNTPRLKVTYQNSEASHDVIFRMVGNEDRPDLEAALIALLPKLNDLVAAAEVTNVQFAADGSDLFFPVPGSALLGVTFGTGAATSETNSRFLQFGGRSTGGRRTKAYFFGYLGATSDYRLTATEEPDVDDIVSDLNNNDAIFTAIDGLATTWYPYANIKSHDHWVKEARNT